MNSPVKDPRSLTKDRLKNELSNHNIALPPSDSRKDIYVDLYRKYILTPTTSSTLSPGKKTKPDLSQRQYRARLEELSCDEEEADSVLVQTKVSKTMNGSGDNDPVTEAEVEALTDDELYMALARRGEKVGPILDSTRRVYQKKLKRILFEEKDATTAYMNGDQNGQGDEYSDQDDEPMETEIIPVKQQQQQPLSKLHSNRQVHEETMETSYLLEQLPKVPTHRPDITMDTSHSSRQQVAMETSRFEHRSAVTKETTTKSTPKKKTGYRVANVEEKPVITHRSIGGSNGQRLREDMVSQVNEVGEQTLASINRKHEEMKKKQGLSIWLQLSIIGICGIVVFLVLVNMEPAYENPAAIENQQ